MNTFKTLSRKSDGKPARIDLDDAGIYDIPVPELLDDIQINSIKTLYPDLEWNDYILEEVAIVRVSDIPSDDEIGRWASLVAFYSEEVQCDCIEYDKVIDLIENIKNQIFK